MRSTRCCVASTKRQKRPPNLADTQRHTSPREALKAVRLLCVEVGVIFFNASKAADRLCSSQHRQQCIGPHGQSSYADTIPSNSALRTDPDPLRPLPLHKHRSTVQRLPATCTTVAKAAACGRKHDVRRQRRGGAADSAGPSSHRRHVRLPVVWPGGATTSHTSAGLWHRRRHSTGTSPQPPAPSKRVLTWLLPASTPDICFPRDGQDMGVLGVASNHSRSRPIIPIDAIPRHPGGRDARVEGALAASAAPAVAWSQR